MLGWSVIFEVWMRGKNRARTLLGVRRTVEEI
jgi:hypothetical protein